MKRPPSIGIIGIATLLATIGCQQIVFDAVTVPPPGRIAELDDSERHITISRGVALAFDCTFQSYGPCGDAAIVSSSTIVGAHIGYAGELQRISDYASDGRGPGDQPVTRFVIIGYETGDTDIDIITEEGEARFAVSVVE